MFPSLPDYRRFAEATIRRTRKDRRRKTDRPARMLFNVLLLAGLWGVPLYARWVILADIGTPKHAHGTIVGTWRATDGSHFLITFTADGQFKLLWQDTIIETARYWFNDGNQNEILVSDFREQPGDRLVSNEEMWWFRASVEGAKLSITHSFSLHEQLRRKFPWHGHRQIEGKRLKLLPAVFERVE
jgi:hypothetical protein